MVLEASTLPQAAGVGLAVIVLIGVITWLCSLLQHDVSLVDSVWSLCIAAAAVVYAALAPDIGERAVAMTLLVIAWALRLSLFITARNWGHDEDRRYQAIRKRNDPGFAFKSLYLVFGLQALLSWMVSAPFLVGVNEMSPLGWLDVAGMAASAFGIVFEAVADAQMARFRSDASNEGRVMDRGLWRYTRHPNYFGEFCIWWGFWVVAMSGAGWSAWWTIVSPLLMTVLLLKVSGVSLLEKDIGERRPGYKDYVVRTNAFVPGPPKRHADRSDRA